MAAKRTQYSMTHQIATLSDLGRMTPFMIQEVAPGDTWSGVTGTLIRMSPLLNPLLFDIFIDLYMFYVPHRLVYANWEDFIAEGPMDTPTYSIPTETVGVTSNAYQSIFWQFNGTTTTSYNALRLYALNLIWNEFFRDEEQPIRTPTDTPGQFGIPINWKKDYWTIMQDTVGTGQTDHFFPTDVGSGTQASAKDVLDAIARQKVAMKRETYGTRYIDILRSYGINVNYQMLQRPEVVGIARSSMNVTDVVQTSADVGALGDLAGHAIGATRMRVKRKTFPEHGTLMGIVCLRPVMVDSSVCDWFDRARTYENFWDPGLTTLPPVLIEQQDITPNIVAAARTSDIGYQPWGDWYRRALTKSHAALASGGGYGFQDFTSTAGLTLDEFRTIDPTDFDNIYANTTFRHWQGSFVNKYRVLRSIPRANAGALLNV